MGYLDSMMGRLKEAEAVYKQALKDTRTRGVSTRIRQACGGGEDVSTGAGWIHQCPRLRSSKHQTHSQKLISPS